MNNIIEVLKRVGALIPNGHFVGTSGRHMDTYINKDALFPHTEEVSHVGKLFAERFKDANIDVVVAPALGGIILSQWTAHHLIALTEKEVLGVYTEKTPNKDQIFTRGYEQFIKNKRVLVVEDLTTTGGSVMKVVQAVKNAGGEVVEVCVMVNKDPIHVNSDTLGVAFSSLAEYSVTSYSAEECVLCATEVPMNTKVGHGKKFIESLETFENQEK